MNKVFIGYDPRQPVAFHVLAHSILARASKPVQITPLVLSQLPIKRRGLTEFTFSRYLVPMLSDFLGRSLFLDPDMLCLSDISEIFELSGQNYPVSVVKNKLRFEWPSLMLFNARHFNCRRLTPGYIDDPATKPQTLDWANEIGELPSEWNHCVGYDPPNSNAKLVHFTMGIPCFEETKDCEFSKAWNQEAYKVMSSVSWGEIMGNSVHVERVRKGFK